MIPKGWFSTEMGNYWRFHPTNNAVRWHVVHREPHTLGPLPGQVLDAAGWYWYAGNISTGQFSAMVGPFDTEMTATADCEASNHG